MNNDLDMSKVLPPVREHIGGYDEEAYTTYCEKCGTLKPTKLLNGKYIRRKCRCQIAIFKAEEERRVQQEIRVAWMRNQTYTTYEWLGSVSRSDMALTRCTFENYVPVRNVYNEDGSVTEVDLTDAFELCRGFAISLTGSLILYGSYGVGKTHLLAAICNEVRLRGIASRFVTAPNLFEAIQERLNRNEEYLPYIIKAIEAPLLCIDDIDKIKASEFREEVYYKIINARSMNGKPTAISTNRHKDLATYIGGAARSRLSIGEIPVEMTGPDYRPELYA